MSAYVIECLVWSLTGFAAGMLVSDSLSIFMARRPVRRR